MLVKIQSVEPRKNEEWVSWEGSHTVNVDTDVKLVFNTGEILLTWVMLYSEFEMAVDSGILFSKTLVTYTNPYFDIFELNKFVESIEVESFVKEELEAIQSLKINFKDGAFIFITLANYVDGKFVNQADALVLTTDEIVMNDLLEAMSIFPIVNKRYTAEDEAWLLEERWAHKVNNRRFK